MRRPFLYALPVVAYLLAFAYFERWPGGILRADALGYYLHLPATFIHQDVGDYTRTLTAWRRYNQSDADPREDRYGLRPTANGRLLDKYPLGVALLESPFFAVAHLVCLCSGGHYAADGFSAPYTLLVGLASPLYALLGLFLLYRTLCVYFSRRIAGWTIAVIALATNLFYFAAINLGMSHPALFFGWSLLIYAAQRYRENPGRRMALLQGAALGIIAIGRPPELIAGLILLFWGSFPRAQAALTFAAFAALALLQLSYWKWVSGQWLLYSYTGEVFHWSKPQILNGLFSYQNGWLVYTPVMVLALAGLWPLRRRIPGAWLSIVLILPLHLYITYAWWCWQYINGFGSRPMVDLYPLLAFPLAALLEWVEPVRWLRLLTAALLLACTALNLHQSWQSAEGLLLSESNHKAFYWAILGQNRVTREAFVAYESKELQPWAPPQRLQVLGSDDMESDTSRPLVPEPHHNGRAALACQSEYCGIVRTPLPPDAAGHWLRAAIWAYVSQATYERRIDRVARLVVDFADAQGQSIKYRSISISSKIGNPENILYSCGKADTWGEAVFFSKIPQGAATVAVYAWNPNGQKITLDDLLVELYE